MAIGISVGYYKFRQRVDKIKPYPLTNAVSTHNDTTTRIVIIGDSWADLADKFNVPGMIDSLMYEKCIKTKTLPKGEHGATSRKIYHNMHTDKKDANSTKMLIDSNPQYAVLFCGINDSHGQYGKKFYAYHTTLIIQELLHHNIKPVVLELPYYDITSQYENYYGLTKRCAYMILSLLTDHTPEVNNIARYRNALKEQMQEQYINDKVIWISIDSLSSQKCYDNNMHLNHYGYECLAKNILYSIISDIKKHRNFKLLY